MGTCICKMTSRPPSSGKEMHTVIRSSENARRVRRTLQDAATLKPQPPCRKGRRIFIRSQEKLICTRISAKRMAICVALLQNGLSLVPGDTSCRSMCYALNAYARLHKPPTVSQKDKTNHYAFYRKCTSGLLAMSRYGEATSSYVLQKQESICYTF